MKYRPRKSCYLAIGVHPRLGVWIEIINSFLVISFCSQVHPRLGVWIEIRRHFSPVKRVIMFTPAWGCGLKFGMQLKGMGTADVHPRLGVWIEIEEWEYNGRSGWVHPRLGVWIEI